MSLTQFQIIQSLGKNLEWFQTEMSWGASAQELRHLTGRIGELYVAMLTRGQMAPENNQRGYDVVSNKNERISVKTVTSSHHVSFNANTLQYVDRVIILRINTKDLSIEILVDEDTETARTKMRWNQTVGSYVIGTANKSSDDEETGAKGIASVEHLLMVKQVNYDDYTIKQYENGSVFVFQNGLLATPAMPILMAMAAQLNVDLLNSAGSKKNTRQLGDHVIKAIVAKDALTDENDDEIRMER